MHQLDGTIDVSYQTLWPGRDVTSSYGVQNSDATVNGIFHQPGSTSTGSRDLANQQGIWANENYALIEDGLSFISPGQQRPNSTADEQESYGPDTVTGTALQRGDCGLPAVVENFSSYDTSPELFGDQQSGLLVNHVPTPLNTSPIVSTGSSSGLPSQGVSLAGPARDTFLVIPTTGVVPTGNGRRFTCLHPGCVRSFARSSDLKRHVGKHNSGARTHHCFENGCNYNGAKGFYRRDKLVDHQKTRHGMHMPVFVPNVNTFSH